MGAFAIDRRRHARRKVRKGCIQPPQRGHMVDHFTDRIRFSSLAAFHQFPGELGRPLEDLSRTTQGWGREANHVARARSSPRCLILIGRVGAAREGHQSAMYFFTFGPYSRIDIPTDR